MKAARPLAVVFADDRPCAKCRNMRRYARAMTMLAMLQQAQIERLTRAVHRDSEFYQRRSVHGKETQYGFGAHKASK